MKIKYRQIRCALWNGSGKIVWKYHIEYSYLGILWAATGPLWDSEQEADRYYEEFIKEEEEQCVKYYDSTSGVS